MRILSGLRVAGLAGILLVAGCESAPSRPTYVSPPDLTTATAATIVGSRQENPHPFVPDARAYVSVIDGALTMVGQYGWDRPILVASGTRSLGLSMSRVDRGLHADATVMLEAGKKYIARVQIISHTTAEVWLEEEGSGRQQGRTRAQIGIYRSPMPPIIVR